MCSQPLAPPSAFADVDWYATVRPSPLMVGSVLSPAAQPSVPTDATVVVLVVRSRTYTSVVVLGSIALSLALEAKTILAPLSSIHGRKLWPGDWPSLSCTLTR